MPQIITFNNHLKPTKQMANQLNSGRLDTLNIDQTLLLQVQEAANDTYQAVFIEKIERGNLPTSNDDSGEIDALASMNYGDDRFQRGSKTYVYSKVTAKGLERLLGIDGFSIENSTFLSETTKAGKVIQVLKLNVLNPVNMDAEHAGYGMRWRVKLVEDTIPTAYQLKNDAGKINPKTKELLTKDGAIIYTHHRVVYSKNAAAHILVEHDKVSAEVESFETADEALSMI